MGDQLFGRRCKLTIALPAGASFADTDHANTIEINGGDTGNSNAPGLRVQFKIHKTSEKEPNTSEITVSNLSPTRRASLQIKGVKAILDAGYEATGLSRLFIGDVRTIDHKREAADWETLMKLGDGERAYRFARVNESFAGGTGAGDVLLRLAHLSGLAIGNVPTIIGNLTRSFDHGYVAYGRWADEMDKLVKSIGYEWSIQDQTLQVMLPDSSLDASVPEISPSTGLVGSPEMGTPEKKGKPALVKFQSLLIPVRPGARVKLVSKRYNGFVRVKKCLFEGDTHGNSWYTTIEGIIAA